jgi:acyl dehydratase
MDYSAPTNTTTPASPACSFDWEAQHSFALLSGDRNPMHMDSVAARRTQAGQPVVHGMHLVLWALDVLCRHKPPAGSLAQITVRFQGLAYVGDVVTLESRFQDGVGSRLELCVDGMVVTTINLIYGQPAITSVQANESAIVASASWPEEPVEFSLEKMANASGWLAFAKSQEEFAHVFPSLSTTIGAKRVAGLACMSRLVGMVCPGMHSIFARFTIKVVEPNSGPDAIHYQVISVDERVRLIKQSVEGAGWSGVIESFARVPPITQPSMEHLATLVRNSEFQGSTALIVGGSRGLGELTAKLIAVGGGAVTITYAVGRNDALEVQRQIQRWGGRCEIMQYDATKRAAEQLVFLNPVTASLYYFATPFIARRKASLFVQSVFNDFLRIYVAGFYDICHELSYGPGSALNVFYPSSVFVESRPVGMTEYTMAKVAAEILCADLARSRKGLHIIVERLPRMLTDQTATVMPIKTASPLEIMLPIVRRVETGI